jgi:cation:H+ antiporter
MILSTLALALGLLMLYFGAEWLVKGSAGLARSLGVRPLIVGLTVVAYGTSMPELVVGAIAAAEGKGDIALGNVVGSNIANLGLILGVTALIAPVRVEGALIKREIPAFALTALLLPALLYDNVVSRLEAGVLLAGAAAFTALVTRSAMGARAIAATAEAGAEVVEADAEAAGAPHVEGRPKLAALAVLGLLLLLGGGKLFVDGASRLALALGMSERLVGLTIVAVGTSLPELAASVVAAVRGHASIAVGNVIGSNVFNVLFVLGGAGAVRPIEGSFRAMKADLVVLLGFTALGGILLRRERTLTRAEGALLVAGYVAFLALASLRG